MSLKSIDRTSLALALIAMACMVDAFGCSYRQVIGPGADAGKEGGEARTDAPAGADGPRDTSLDGPRDLAGADVPPGDGGGADATPKLGANGAVCSAGSDCSSTNCVGSICCDKPCADVCFACTNALTASSPDGTCAAIASGKDDTQARCGTAAAATSCGNTGHCDGKGTCEKYGGTTTCMQPSCGSGSFIPAATCDGKGACAAAAAQDCQGFTCSVTSGCATACTADTDCINGYCTAAKTCAAKKIDGSTCGGNNECVHASCVGGICCESQCTGLCDSCAQADTNQQSGLCKPIKAMGSSKGLCAVDAATCGRDGTCDGNGACRFVTAGTSCGSASCANAQLSPAPTCNGGGACGTPTPGACPNALVCASVTTCKTTCAADTDCVSGDYCNGGSCAAKKAGGASCGGGNECAAGNCRDAICCPAGCTLSCQGCAQSVTAQSNGTCAARTSNPAGTQICNNQCAIVNGTDAANCGSCGHSCLGGACSAGVCQPLSLGAIPSGFSASLILSGGALYVPTAAAMTNPNVWKLDPNTTSTAVLIGSGFYSSPRCVMDGKIFWVSANMGTFVSSPISVCSVSNCTGTTQVLVNSPGQVEDNPVCDTSTDELVWDDLTTPFPGSTDSITTIYRIATNGTNMRTMTSFYQLLGNDYFLGTGFVNGRADRYFFMREMFPTTPGTGSETVYYALTNSLNISPVSIVTGTPGQNGLNLGLTAFANDTLFVWPDNSGFSQVTFDVPLPNGVTGAPPVFYEGYLGGVMDNQKFYGTFTTLPTDAIGSCAVSNCASPTILFRGQASANAFTQDATAIYWTTPNTTGAGFTVWKGAK
jgi:hypothetical protein